MTPFAVMRLRHGSTVVLTGLDSYTTGLKAVRALKRKYTGYSGNCIRIRRSSDNAEQDIGFVSSAVDAAVNSAGAVTFAGGGSAYVTTIYDQSGAGDHWVQATSSKQPRVVNSGVWDGFVRFDGTDDSMQSTNNCGTVSTYHVAFVANSRANTAGKMYFERGISTGGNSNNEHAVYLGTLSAIAQVVLFKAQTSVNNYGSGYAASSKAPNGTDANWAMLGYASAGAASLELWRASTKYTTDGTVNFGTVGTGTVGTASKWYLGARNNTSDYMDMNWKADAVYEGTVSDADKAAIQAILQR